MTDEIIAQYIKDQDLEEKTRTDNFTIITTLGCFSSILNLPALAGRFSSINNID